MRKPRLKSPSPADFLDYRRVAVRLDRRLFTAQGRNKIKRCLNKRYGPGWEFFSMTGFQILAYSLDTDQVEEDWILLEFVRKRKKLPKSKKGTRPR